MNTHGGYYGKNAKMVDFSININPLGMPTRLRYDLIGIMDDLKKYPEITGESHSYYLASQLNLDENQVILGNGAIELIYLFARGLYQQGGKALIVVPTFNEYERALKMNGWDSIEKWQLEADKDFRLNPQDFVAAVREKAPQAVYICNPNNPTGMAYSCDYLRGIIEELDPNINWFIDESFIDFSAKESCLELVQEGKYRVFLLRSMTKFFGIPGVRVGYGIGHPHIIQAMWRYKEPWTINAFALKAVESLFQEVAFIKNSKKFMKEERHRVYLELSKLKGLKVFQSSADFHLCQLRTGAAEDLNSALNLRNINIRTCMDFSGLNENYFRIAIKRKEENNLLLYALKDILK